MLCITGGFRSPLVGQQIQVLAFCLIQTQCPCQVVQKAGGYSDFTPLFQPGVPGQTHPGECGDFFTAQTGSTAA